MQSDVCPVSLQEDRCECYQYEFLVAHTLYRGFKTSPLSFIVGRAEK